jgi:hypothetical protein
MNAKTDIQIVDINKDQVPCQGCGVNIVDVANFTFDGEIFSEPRYREEKCKCRNCGASFILHYDLFDVEGHIHSRVFSEDINSPSYHWPEALADNQKQTITGHLKDCKVCQDRLDQEILTDAWLKDIMDQLRKVSKKISDE